METCVSVPMTVEEREALRASARRELRHPQDQARYLLRLALGLANRAENADRGAVDSDPQHAAAAS